MSELYDYTCPITRGTMVDPVIASDKWTYEREAIISWLVISDTSPMTREKLSAKLTPNHELRAKMEADGHIMKSLGYTVVPGVGFIMAESLAERRDLSNIIGFMIDSNLQRMSLPMVFSDIRPIEPPSTLTPLPVITDSMFNFNN